MITYRVNRGGGWRIDDATFLAARARRRLAPSYRAFYLGFRCARLTCSQPVSADRVLRGGSWYYDAAGCRASGRFSHGPGGASSNFELRCVRPYDEY